MERDKLYLLGDLYQDLLKELYGMEVALISAIPRMAVKANDPDLKDNLNHHLEETKKQRQRLQQILGENAVAETPETIKGLEADFQKLATKDVERDVMNAAVILAAQRVEHYEIASYGTACYYAKILGKDADLQLLKESMAEEVAADEKLNRLAKSKIDEKAIKVDQPSNFFGRHG